MLKKSLQILAVVAVMLATALSAHAQDVTVVLDEKFAAFGLFVQTVDGHDFDAIDEAVKRAEAEKGRPSAIVLKTVKGKGVSFMENQMGWHGKAPNDEQYHAAMEELEKALREEEAE